MSGRSGNRTRHPATTGAARTTAEPAATARLRLNTAEIITHTPFVDSHAVRAGLLGRATDHQLRERRSVGQLRPAAHVPVH
ncbi:hypothetical protein AB0J74_00800 [Asanoa sp. NPDC049573]|uniref:hypothetical protein n=1 Tax=Asanoa sp. NPDC049573 TaxID=3155396 RepID=UPI00343509C0